MTDLNLNPGDKKILDSVIDKFSDLAVKGWQHPNIDPVALHLGPLELRWYSLAYLAGIILGWLIVGHLNKKYGKNYLTEKALEALPLWIVLSVVLGGRIGYILFYNLEYYLNNLSDILKVWHGGMSFHGGLAGVIVGTYIFSKVYKLEFFKVTDLLAVVTPIGLFFGRIANFINKELFGKMTDSSWGVIYPKENFARHPSQLYEAATEGLLLFIILLVAVKFFNALDRKGALSGLFLIGYGTFRAFCEHFREPDKQLGYVIENISMGQLLCIPMILAGVVILLLSKRTNELKN
jgi:phosphatidylglycerol:prolipoprotein diacylglycerol transferase